MKAPRISKEEDVVVLEIHTDKPFWRVFLAIALGLVCLLGIYLFLKALGVGYFEDLGWIVRRSPFKLLPFFLYLWLLSFIFRKFLWFTVGREVVVIYPDKLHYYKHLRYFAESKTKTPYQDLEIIYRKIGKENSSTSSHLVDDILIPNSQVIIAFRLDHKTVVDTRLPIRHSEMEELGRLLKG